MNPHLSAFRDLLADLGFRLDARRGPGSIEEGAVVREGVAVARFRFFQNRPGDRLCLTVTPSDPERATVMAGSGSVDPEIFDRTLAEISMLFRSRLVLDGDLPYERLPDAFHLLAWARRVEARVGLPGDGRRRRPLVAKDPESRALVAELRRVMSDGSDPDALLAIHCDCCLLGIGADPARFLLRESASMDALMGVLAATWSTGSALAPIVRGSASFVSDVPRRRLDEIDIVAPVPGA